MTDAEHGLEGEDAAAMRQWELDHPDGVITDLEKQSMTQMVEVHGRLCGWEPLPAKDSHR